MRRTTIPARLRSTDPEVRIARPLEAPLRLCSHCFFWRQRQRRDRSSPQPPASSHLSPPSLIAQTARLRPHRLVCCFLLCRARSRQRPGPAPQTAASLAQAPAAGCQEPRRRQRRRGGGPRKHWRGEKGSGRRTRPARGAKTARDCRRPVFIVIGVGGGRG